MSERILCVDDEPNVLAGYRRQLRKQFDIEVARGGEEGLDALARGPFAVIVSDMRMPGLSGAQFLARVREAAPDSVRMLLTGFADQQAAIAAVNDGHIFRFLTKPCPPETFLKALAAGVRQYRLLQSEKELLEHTLRGSIKVLTEVLSLVNPSAFGRAARVQRLARRLAETLRLEDVWRIEVAAMLSQIGCVTVPEPVLAKVFHDTDLCPHDLDMFERHPRIGAELIGKIPRLESVAEIIAYQEKHFDGNGLPADDRKGSAIPVGARILKAALDFDCLEAREHSPKTALERLKYRDGWYDPAVLDALERIAEEEASYESQVLRVGDMRGGMILAEDAVAVNGVMLLRKGQEVRETLLQRLRNLSASGLIREPIRVLVPSHPCTR